MPQTPLPKQGLKCWGEAMKSPNSAGLFKPFKSLKVLLESRALQMQPAPDGPPSAPACQRDRRPEHVLFEEAMVDVKRIARDNCVLRSPFPKTTQPAKEGLPDETLVRLKNLIKYGDGFDVSLTPEYVEGIANGVAPEIARRLHRGEFSIQAHIDLHGLRVHEAREVINEFLEKSIATGKRAVLIIHGRGLSSPVKPVLKSKVYLWLTTSPWHKWVIAFTSARACDGGTGAIYVLLRQKPLTKRFRKKRTGSR
jgi:DNA-nicking Smr family endonuclease